MVNTFSFHSKMEVSNGFRLKVFHLGAIYIFNLYLKNENKSYQCQGLLYRTVKNIYFSIECDK